MAGVRRALVARWYRGVALLVVLGGLAFSAFSASDGAASRPAPALPSEAISGSAVSVDSLGGRATAVNFWASWCEPCREEAPQLRALASNPPRGTQLVGVNFRDEEAGARSFLRYYRWRFPNLLDPDGSVGNEYGVVGLPVTFILDRDGRIVQTLEGMQTAASLREALIAART